MDPTPIVNEYAWIKDATQFGALGIVAFGAHFLLTKTFPGLVATFTSEIQAQRTLHAATMDNQRRDFLAELQAERASNIAASQLMLATFRDQQKELLQMRCLRPACGSIALSDPKP